MACRDNVYLPRAAAQAACRQCGAGVLEVVGMHYHGSVQAVQNPCQLQGADKVERSAQR